MEFVAILRVLRRRWLLLLPGAVLACLAGLSAVYHLSFAPPGLGSRSTTGGEASGRVLLSALDVPAFDLDSEISATLPNRAVMLSDMMATDRLRDDIARRAGISASELAVLGPASEAPEYAVPIAVEATAAAAMPREPYLVTVRTGKQLPIIAVRASAPTEREAAKVVDAVRAAMESTIQRLGGDDPAVGAERLGLVSSRTVVNEPPKAAAVAVACVLFVMWAGAVVLLVGIARRVRVLRGRPKTSPAPA